MTPDRIAELLHSFLAAPFSTPHSSSPCHSEPSRRRGEEPTLRSSRQPDQLSDAEPAILSPAQLQHISTYIDLLIRWNARINLTAIRDPEEIVTRHFGESLFAARCLFPSIPSAAIPASNAAGPSTPCTLADVGSGAGFPGLPIKLWAPHIALTLIESNHKKATFLREVTRALTLINVNIQISRVESLAASPLTRPQFDIVTMRAVERFDSILPQVAAMVAPVGRLALLIGAAQLDATQHHPALPPSDLSWLKPVPVPLSNSRILAIALRGE